MEQQPFLELMDRYISNAFTPDDLVQLKELLNDPAYLDMLDGYMMQARAAVPEEYGEPDPVTLQRIHRFMEKLQQQELPVGKDERILPQEEQDEQTGLIRSLPYRRRWKWIAAAAAVSIVAGSFWFLGKSGNQSQDPVMVETPVLPGMNGAVITLADGTQQELDSSSNRSVSLKDGRVLQLKDGRLLDGSGRAAGKVEYNTISTPRGRQFMTILSDGTRVWLNAASSIRYPASFKGAERKVEIKGEVYFEVAQNRHQPFIVNTAEGIDIKVLGTSFNVNAYSNEESLNTTLLEGAVQLTVGGTHTVLKPGQQAQVTLSGRGREKDRISIIAGADIEKAVAWKNGVFRFDGSSLKEVMQQLERWYNIEVVYENGIPNMHFGGEMSRNSTLSEVLTGLKNARVKFRIENGKKLIVTQ